MSIIEPRLSGVEILGTGMGKGFFKKAFKYTPHMMLYKAARSGIKSRGRKVSLFGSDPTWNDIIMGLELLGKKKGKFLPGLTKAVKTVGKFTSPITTAAAKTFLPSSVVNAAAKLDPTRKTVTPKDVAKAVDIAVKQDNPVILTDTDAKKDALIKTLTDPKVLGIAAGGIVLLILISQRGGK